ncbi:MAG: sigma-70 family RNA polymerase sigma factor, partial [Myxococcales bacterium]|nr:sigma-70 family RNA polymerase sigma factor [Myxococcales bacterium]
VAELGASPSQLVAEDQRQQLMLTALRRIPLDHQTVLELHYWEDMTAQEVGEVLQVPVGTAKTRLRRAKQLLAAELHDLLTGTTGAEPTETRLDTWARGIRGRLR